MESGTSDQKALLNLHGLKATSQRLLIMGVMARLGHACADMVWEEIEKESAAGDRKYTLATVYNTLKSLADVGILVRLPSVGSKMYFDINTYNHCHLCDTLSESVTDYDDPQLITLISDYLASKKPDNFQLEHIDVQLTGKYIK